MPIKIKSLLTNPTLYVCGLLLLFSNVPSLVFAKDTISSEAFGANIHLRQRHTESDWEEVLAAAESSGVQWGREQFNWDTIEPTDGTFEFDSYDSVIAAYQDHGIQPLGLLTYSSSWASSNSGATDYEFYPPDVEAWENYVQRVAAHYADSVTYWEIWNEPNHGGFWYGDTADYVELLETAIYAIREVNPDAKIVLGGLSGSDTDFLEDVLNQLNDPSELDVIAIHPYRTVDGSFNYAPETSADGLNSLTTDIYNIKAIMNRFGLTTTPLWLTEVGWTTGEDGVSERRQGEYLTRLYTMALAIPDVKKVFWYTLADTSADESIDDAQFGLYEDDLAIKQAETAYRFVATELSGKWLKDQTLPVAGVVDNFSTGLGWHFAGAVCTNGSLNDHDDGKLSVRYTFTADTNCYVPITLGKQLTSGTQALQFRLKGDNNSTLLRVRVIDSTGETFQYNLGYMPKEWLYYNIQLTNPSSWWNGNHDGKLDQPITLDSIVLDDTDGLRETGTLQMDDLIASTQANTYLYRFHADHKDAYAYWSTAQERRRRILLSGAGRITERLWRYADVKRTSGDGYYRLRSRNEVTFLETR